MIGDKEETLMPDCGEVIVKTFPVAAVLGFAGGRAAVDRSFSGLPCAQS